MAVVQRDTVQTVFEAVDKTSRVMTNIGRGLGRLSGATAALSAASGALAGGAVIRGIIGATSAMQQYEARMLTVLGTYERMNRAMEQLRAFERATPFTLQETIDGYIRLLNYGLNPTMDRMRKIGDFAASAGRSMTDTVEALSDASRGEFERIREFGLTQEMIDRFGTNLRTAQGKIKDMGKWLDAIFDAMEARSRDGMLRLQNTLIGKWSNIQSRLFQIGAGIGRGLEKPLFNLMIVADRLLERVFGSNIDEIAARVAKIFSVDNMKNFAKAALLTVERIRDAFASIPDIFTIVAAKLQLIFLDVEEFLARIGNAFDAFASGNLKGIGAALRGEQGDMIGSLTRIAQRAIITAQSEAAGQRIRDRADRRADSGKVIDELFAGLNDQPLRQKEGLGALFNALSGNGTSALNKFQEFMFGGGELARLGMKASEFGPGFSPEQAGPIQINATGAQRHLKQFIEGVALETIQGAIRKGILAIPGGQ